MSDIYLRSVGAWFGREKLASNLDSRCGNRVEVVRVVGVLSGREGELESSVVRPWDWGFEVGVAGVDELWVVAA